MMGAYPKVGTVCAGALASLAFACGGHKDLTLGSTGGGGEQGAPDSGSPNDSSTATFSGDDGGSSAIFTGGDDGGSSVVFDCQPGTYTGTFATMVTNDAGGIWSLFSVSWAGSLSITLQGMAQQSGGGEIPLPTLTIAPGAKLDGADMNGGHFIADMTGTLDCPSKKLNVTIANGAYEFFLDSGSIPLGGTMTATYDGNSNPPQLTMGAISVGSPSVPGSDAEGAWSAMLQ
jgi:hypothetical protein